MSRHNKKSLVRQVDERLQKMTQQGIGRSKHQDKQDAISHNYIYSWSTYKSYMKHCCYFVQWCKVHYGCKNLKQCWEHIPEWLDVRRETVSASTQKLEVAALAKLYNVQHRRGRKPFDSVETDTRKRANIKRSRNDVVRDKHFSQSNNADLVTFCRCSGLRRAELQELRYEDLRLAAPDGSESTGLYVHHNTKGGRPRRIDFVGTPAEIEICYQIMLTGHGQDKVWGKVHSAADIHSYRADYATKVYKMYARPIDEIKNRKELYFCRGDRKGLCLDRNAMRLASNALGHNRVSIIASNYLQIDKL